MQGKHRLLSGNASASNPSSPLTNLSYYDVALVVVPLPLVVGSIVGKLSAVSPHLGLLVGAVLSAMTVGHLLFGEPPTRRGPRGSGGRVGGSSA